MHFMKTDKEHMNVHSNKKEKRTKAGSENT